jgi:hypothetical protein
MVQTGSARGVWGRRVQSWRSASINSALLIDERPAIFRSLANFMQLADRHVLQRLGGRLPADASQHRGSLGCDDREDGRVPGRTRAA